MDQLATDSVNVPLNGYIGRKFAPTFKFTAALAGCSSAQALVGSISEPTKAVNPNDLPYEIWLARFEAWVKTHPKVDVVVDDSRETIYEGRGE